MTDVRYDPGERADAVAAKQIAAAKPKKSKKKAKK